MTDFKIGDRIEITNSGQCYSGYPELAEKLNATKYDSCLSCVNGETGIIKNIDYGADEIALVDLGEHEYLIGLKGIKKIEEFKIGDRIEIIDDGNCYSGYTELAEKLNATKFADCKSCENGTTGIIKNIGKHQNENTQIALVDLGEHEYLIGIKGIKKLNQLSEEKFKEGDRVISIAKCSFDNNIAIGEYGIIDSIPSDGNIYVIFDIDKSGNKYAGKIKNPKIKLVKEEKFKEGDRVISIAKCSYDKNIAIGEKGRIKHIYKTGNIFVIFDSDKNNVRFAGTIENPKIKLINKMENIKQEVNKKMEIKDMNKKNLVEAKKQFEEEKTNAEIVEAKRMLRDATDSIDSLNRQIKDLEDAKKQHADIVKNFK